MRLAATATAPPSCLPSLRAHYGITTRLPSVYVQQFSEKKRKRRRYKISSSFFCGLSFGANYFVALSNRQQLESEEKRIKSRRIQRQSLFYAHTTHHTHFHVAQQNPSSRRAHFRAWTMQRIKQKQWKQAKRKKNKNNITKALTLYLNIFKINMVIIIISISLVRSLCVHKRTHQFRHWTTFLVIDLAQLTCHCSRYSSLLSALLFNFSKICFFSLLLSLLLLWAHIPHTVYFVITNFVRMNERMKCKLIDVVCIINVNVLLIQLLKTLRMISIQRRWNSCHTQTHKQR